MSGSSDPYASDSPAGTTTLAAVTIASSHPAATTMRLGAFVSPTHAVTVAVEAERLGFRHVLAPEGFRGDAASVLGAVAARTDRIGLASGVMQIPARPPVAAALTAATLDAISGERFHLGLGVSNRDVSVGWYGVDFARPLARTREYVEVVRAALAGRPVRHLHGSQDGVPAVLAGLSPRAELPVFLGGVGPRGVALAGAIADGWIGAFCTPEQVTENRRLIEAARGDRGLDGFEIIPSVPIGLGESDEEAAHGLRGYYANFLGLGHRPDGVYAKLAGALGFEREAARVHELCRGGDRAGAARAVPLGLIAATALLGDVDTIARRLADYRRAGVTTLGLTLLSSDVGSQLAAMTTAAEAAEVAGLTQPVIGVGR